MKVVNFARRVAHEEGFKPISNQDLDYLIWERTGYPAFWQTDNPITEFESQLRAAFQQLKRGEAKDWKGETP